MSTHRPPAPLNISVVQQRNGLMLKWLPPRESHTSASLHRPIEAYVVQYRTVGQWVDLTDRIKADRTWYEWKTASRGATYHFRVLSYDGDAFSEPSPAVIFHTGGQ